MLALVLLGRKTAIQISELLQQHRLPLHCLCRLVGKLLRVFLFQLDQFSAQLRLLLTMLPLDLNDEVLALSFRGVTLHGHLLLEIGLREMRARLHPLDFSRAPRLLRDEELIDRRNLFLLVIDPKHKRSDLSSHTNHQRLHRRGLHVMVDGGAQRGSYDSQRTAV